MLKIVTFTGADDSIPAIDLSELSIIFPWVEWALLLSRNSQGTNRFPSNGFLNKVYTEGGPHLRLSGHLCGAYVRELLLGKDSFIERDIPTWTMYNRIQINTHGTIHDYDSTGLSAIIKRYPEKEFIFQYDNENTDILNSVLSAGCTNVSTLFDLSHGAGVLPKDWPSPIPNVRCGYAGGISPTNIELQIRRIEQKVGSLRTWIDMETHVRSNGDKLFDLQKVRTCINIASLYIQK